MKHTRPIRVRNSAMEKNEDRIYDIFEKFPAYRSIPAAMLSTRKVSKNVLSNRFQKICCFTWLFMNETFLFWLNFAMLIVAKDKSKSRNAHMSTKPAFANRLFLRKCMRLKRSDFATSFASRPNTEVISSSISNGSYLTK